MKSDTSNILILNLSICPSKYYLICSSCVLIFNFLLWQSAAGFIWTSHTVTSGGRQSVSTAENKTTVSQSNKLLFSLRNKRIETQISLQSLNLQWSNKVLLPNIRKCTNVREEFHHLTDKKQKKSLNTSGKKSKN